jgi:hypothetical protein
MVLPVPTAPEAVVLIGSCVVRLHDQGRLKLRRFGLVLVSARSDAAAARRLFRRALTMLKVTPSEVVTDATPIYPAVLERST